MTLRVATIEDKAEIEAMVNHPGVLPMISYDSMPAFDATPYLTAPHMVLMMKGGCFLATWNGMGRFEAHTIFLPEARGKNAVIEAEQALRYVFLHTECHEVATRVPYCNRAAYWLADKLGFRRLFTRDAAWTVKEVTWPVGYYQLGIDEWICHGDCAVSGHEFHRKLDAMLPDHPKHPIDYIHDCYVGAAVELIKAGYVDKAILFYNRWAILAGYQHIVKVSDKPLVLDLKEFLIEVGEGDFKVREPSCLA